MGLRGASLLPCSRYDVVSWPAAARGIGGQSCSRASLNSSWLLRYRWKGAARGAAPKTSACFAMLCSSSWCRRRQRGALGGRHVCSDRAVSAASRTCTCFCRQGRHTPATSTRAWITLWVGELRAASWRLHVQWSAGYHHQSPSGRCPIAPGTSWDHYTNCPLNGFHSEY